MTEQFQAPSAELKLDTHGLMCPEPIMMLHQAVRKVESGACIHIIATDPATQRDIPKFCLHLGHELVSTKISEDELLFEYWVKKQ